MPGSSDSGSNVQLPLNCFQLLIESLDRLYHPVPLALHDAHREAIILLSERVAEKDGNQLAILNDIDPFCLEDECGKDCAGIAYAKGVGELVGEEGPNRHLFSPKIEIDGKLSEDHQQIEPAITSGKQVTITGSSVGCYMGQLVPGVPTPVRFHARKVALQLPTTGPWGGTWVQSSLYKNWYRLSSDFPDSMQKGPPIKNNRPGEWGAELSTWGEAASPTDPTVKINDDGPVEEFPVELVSAVATLLKWIVSRCDYSVCKDPPPLHPSQVTVLRSNLSPSLLAKVLPHVLTAEELLLVAPPLGVHELVAPKLFHKNGGVRPASESADCLLTGLIIKEASPTFVCYPISKKFALPYGKIRLAASTKSSCIALINVSSEEDLTSSSSSSVSSMSISSSSSDEDSSTSESSLSSSVELIKKKPKKAPSKKSAAKPKPKPKSKPKPTPKAKKPAKKIVKNKQPSAKTPAPKKKKGLEDDDILSDISSGSEGDLDKAKDSYLLKPASKMSFTERKKLFANLDVPENVISEPQDMFTDMAKRLTKLYPQLVKNLKHIARPLRVATMCSGTESPLLALHMFEKAFGVSIINHVFSCEIEPYKQAYIERNFAPKLLFRDIRELASATATTAYGSSVPVPGDVDIVVAGTVCKDFSTINKFRKGIHEGGQSGETFKGMIDYVQKHAPKLVILENVRGAPWDEMASLFEQLTLPGGKKYKAGYLRLDTKHFYIPQTRQRGYLCAALEGTPAKLQAWGEMVMALEKPSGPILNHFLLPDDDPRVLNAKSKVVRKVRGRIDWGRCELRHANERNSGGLGPKRPVTNWNESGVSPPDWSWHQWIAGQPHRVNDLIDLRYLGFANEAAPDDAHWRCVVWNLSQNVDRGNSSARGICPCLTPTMIAYISNRGGPIIGAETLFLQGIPINDLLLTRETDRQLADLAGNAMSSTVVGACIISSILTLYPLATRSESSKNTLERIISLPIIDTTVVTDFSSTFCKDIEHCSHGADEAYFSSFYKSAMLCSCEWGTTTDNQILKCVACGYSACCNCAGNPQHQYEPIQIHDRIDFGTVTDILLSILPKRFLIQIDNNDPNFSSRISCESWKIYVRELQQYLESPLRFTSLTRSRKWAASYTSESGIVKAIFTICEDHPLGRWSVFITRPAKHPFFSVVGFKRPVLVMDCVYPGQGKSFNYTTGNIRLRKPEIETATMSITGSNEGDSWQVSLGLQGSSIVKKVYNTLTIQNCDTKRMTSADGVYQRLPKCGGATGVLYKRDGPPNATNSFLYLNPDIMGTPATDTCEFSSTYAARLMSGEPTDPILSCKPGWTPGRVQSEVTQCSLLGSYINLAGSMQTLSPFDKLHLPPENEAPKLEFGNCSLSFTIAKCTVSQVCRNDEWVSCGSGDVGWALSSMPFSKDFEDWRPVLAETKFDCAACSPPQPDIKWTSKGVPYEAGDSAAEYEVALKKKPKGVGAQIRRLSDTKSEIRVIINPVMLVHTAASKIPSLKGTTYSWRAARVSNTSVGFVPFPAAELVSNRHDKEYQSPPEFNKDLKLRKEQLRSLTWMVERESKDQEPFIQSEVENQLFCNVLVEGRVSVPKLVRGGVLADEVGYGKTVMSLALIAATTQSDNDDDDSDESTGGSTSEEGTEIAKTIRSSATLVVVPAHLISQWPQELQKFLSRDFSFVVLKTPSDIVKHFAKLSQVSIVFITTSLLTSKARMPASFGDATGRRFSYLYTNLSDADRQAMKLELIKWKRVIIDEFSFVLDSVEQCAVLGNLKRNCTWLLTGTPCVSTFDDVSKMAQLLGVYIGDPTVDDINKKSLTDAERFHAMSSVRPSSWYVHRNESAKSFLQKFVRQNIAEIDELPISFATRNVRMSHTHSSIYSELESLIKTLDVTQYHRGWGTDNDRDSRVSALLGNSTSPEEALLKLACTYNLYTDTSVSSSYRKIVQLRQAQLKECAAKVVELLKEATRMRNQIRAKTKKSTFWGKMENWADSATNEDMEVKEWITGKIAEAEKMSQKVNKNAKPPTEFELSEKVHVLRSSVREYVTRVRSLRFLQTSHKIHQTDVPCDIHSTVHTDLPSEPCVTTCCGHFGCSSIFLSAAENSDTCPVKGCNGLIKQSDIVLRSQLEDLPDSTPTKIQEVAHFITGTAAYPNEKVLVFVQFQDIHNLIVSELKASGSKYATLFDSDKVTAIESFQRPDVKILLLPLDEGSSGLNLTQARNVVFTHPILAPSVCRYAALEKQAIGRAHRFGQLEEVFVTRFIVQHTIDERILTQRMAEMGVK